MEANVSGEKNTACGVEGLQANLASNNTDYWRFVGGTGTLQVAVGQVILVLLLRVNTKA